MYIELETRTLFTQRLAFIERHYDCFLQAQRSNENKIGVIKMIVDPDYRLHQPFMPGHLHYDVGEALKRCHQDNNFYHTLVGFVGERATLSLLFLYHLGTVNTPGSGIISLLLKNESPYDGFSDGVFDLFHPYTGRSILVLVDYGSECLLEILHIDILHKADRDVSIGESLVDSVLEKAILITYPLITATLRDHLFRGYNSLALDQHHEVLFRDASLLRRLYSEIICFVSDDLDTQEGVQPFNFCSYLMLVRSYCIMRVTLYKPTALVRI